MLLAPLGLWLSRPLLCGSAAVGPTWITIARSANKFSISRRPLWNPGNSDEESSQHRLIARSEAMGGMALRVGA
jgi:hypothetical protein